MKKFLKNPSGFTLVELMVVVAIIGILSAIAIPNFKKYQAKSKQSEAKIQLAALYAVEVASSADYDTYATCLSIMGYDQPERGYYTTGFKNKFNAKGENASYTGCDGSAISMLPPKVILSTTATKNSTVAFASSKADKLTFTAASEGQIGSVDKVLDVWSINEKKDLKIETQGY